MDTKIFRKYDIRGIVPTQLNEQIITTIAQAFIEKYHNTSLNTIVIAHDARSHSPSLALALKNALLQHLPSSSPPSKILNLNLTTTPMLYFASQKYNADAAFMITGSHNPPQYNGIKILLKNKALYGDKLQELKNIIPQLKNDNAPQQNINNVTTEQLNIFPEYLKTLQSFLNFGPHRPKVVIDAANAATAPFIIPILEHFNFQPIPLFCEIDSKFPNHHPDPSIDENLKHLKERVQQTKATLGISFDGDGDRIGLVDHNANTVENDKLLLFLAENILDSNPNATFLVDIKASNLIFNKIKNKNGIPIPTQTGHSIIKHKLRETKALLAGEMSGHFFFNHRWFGFDDAIYTALRILEILSHNPNAITNFVNNLPKTYTTPEIRIDCSDDLKELIVQDFLQDYNAKLEKEPEKFEIITLDGIRVNFKNAWFILRASNTQPALSLRFEASSTQECENLKKQTLDKIQQYINKRQKQ